MKRLINLVKVAFVSLVFATLTIIGATVVWSLLPTHGDFVDVFIQFWRAEIVAVATLLWIPFVAKRLR